MSSTSPTNEENGKMFVGGLSWETSEDTLSNYFARFGEVADCVVMKNGETGRSRGFGFVTFKDAACVQIVIAGTPHNLDGRTIDPKACNPRGQQQRQPRRENVNVNQNRRSESPKIFLGGLPASINETDLKSFFAKYGKVSEVVIMYDQEKKRSRGFGFVSFETDDSVDRVCAERFIIIDGKQVEAKRAEPRDSDRNMGGRRGRPNDGWGSNGMGPGGMSHHHGGPHMGGPGPMDNGGPISPIGYPSAGWGPPSAHPYPAQGSYGSPPGGYQGWGVQPSPYSPYGAPPQYVQPPAYATPGYGYGYGWPAGAPPQVGIPVVGSMPATNGSAAVANGDQYATPPVPEYVAAPPPGTHPPPPSTTAVAKESKEAEYNSYTSSYGGEAYPQDASSYQSRPRGAQDGFSAGNGESAAPSGGARSGAHSQGAGYHPYRRQ